ncbi:uncharacterized protein ACA1_058550 [Acanthamoeba castellanii str. Neff]|uniref:RXYLT1 C-terminal domain-containing protein n=1 Tax=Acanthamoeba castellanii (strain ATCC 30010 / Neff) TaxID=1257118 RepID=L8GVF8_ACACF|nr:uncharacterized protein ACA1_058550 [Acanthamoeba castellanii str. Neff]ELR17199.1 hypothetical protein ACA1_058550 [Acanthamoeba castellanii str. Neff]
MASSLCARMVWLSMMALRRAVHTVRKKGLANCLVFTFPLLVMAGMFYIGLFGYHREKASLVQIVSYGQEAGGISFDKTNPYRFCAHGDGDASALNVIVLDESRVVPDFLVHDWIQSVMFEAVEPRRSVNLILEKGEAEIAASSSGRSSSSSSDLGDDLRGPVIRRKGDAMVGEREREERKIHLWRDGRYKNLFCNHSIIVVQTKACSPVGRDHQFIHNYLQQARQLGISVLGVIHSDDEYPDYQRKGKPAASTTSAGLLADDDVAMAMARAGQAADNDDGDDGEAEAEGDDDATLERAKRGRREGDGNGGNGGGVLPQSTCADRDWYAQANFVYRPYWSRAIKQRYPNVKWMPLGTRAGFGSLLHSNSIVPTASRRSHLCTFIGSVSSRRDAFYRSLLLDGRCFVMKLRREDYDIWRDRRLMLDSAITLAPSAINRETHRIYEALEAGSIPIIDKTKWANYDNDSFIPFGDDCPLPAVKEDWTEELPALLNHLSDPEVMDRTQREVTEWWKTVRLSFQVDVKNTIAHALAKADKRAHSPAS